MTHIWVHHPSEVEIERCPRCNTTLWVELDPAEGYCINCGSVSIVHEEPLPLVPMHDTQVRVPSDEVEE